MTPPPITLSYEDPYGTFIRRITDCRNMNNAADGGRLGWCSPEYSSICPWSLSNSYLILQHQSYFGLYTGAGAMVENLPFGIHASAEPRWSRIIPDRIYFISGDKIVAYSINDRAILFTQALPYSALSGKGEGDFAQDHDRLVLIGDNREAFIYDCNTRQRSVPVQTQGRPIDSLYISPDGTQFTVTWNDGGGVELYNWNGQLVHKLAQTGSHMDICRDPITGRSWLVRFNSNDNPHLSGCVNGVEKVALDDPNVRMCLLALGWANSVESNILTVHISCTDVGKVLVETYNASGNMDLPYSNELILVNLDGSGVRPLCQHHSRVDNYASMPLATISRDGKRFIFGSDFGLFPEDSTYKDVYMGSIDLGASPPAPPAPPVPPPPPTPPPSVSDPNPIVARIKAKAPAGAKKTVGEWNKLAYEVIGEAIPLPTAGMLGLGQGGKRPRFEEWLEALRGMSAAKLYKMD